MAITMDGIFVNGQKVTFQPENILSGDASAYTEEIGTAVEEWMEKNVTGGEQVTDTTLTLPGVPADAKKTGDEFSELKEDLTDVFTDLTELSKEVDGNIPLRYRTTTGTANETVPLIDHFALEKSTQYTFTFRIKEAINTNVYFYIYRDQETSLLTKTLSAGDTSAVYTYTTSSSVPFTDGKIDVKVNKADVYCEVEIRPTVAINSRIDKIETQLNTDVARVEGKADTALDNTATLADATSNNRSLIDILASEIGAELPSKYSMVTGTANVETAFVPHLSLEAGTSYTFTFTLKEAINTNVYVRIYKDQSTSLITRTISAGNTSNTYTYTTSSSVPFTDGKITVTVNKANVHVDATIEKTAGIISKIDNILEQPLTTLPAYIKGNLAYKPLGALTKPYLCLVSDDGNIALNTYTIPMLLEKEVPCTFALFAESAVLADDTNIAIVKNAITNGGCSVAQHGGHYWTQFTEKSLTAFFDTEAEFFADLEIDINGAVLPGHYCNDMIASLVGGRFGVVRSGYDGHGQSRIVKYGTYANGARSNLYSLTSFNIADYSEQNVKNAIDDAIANNYLMFIYWHDDSLSASDKTHLENVIDYAKSAGINFITLGDVLTIT